MRPRLVRVGGAALCVLAIGAQPARAAAPVMIGAGSQAAATVDAAGTAYIAFNGLANSSNQPLRLCRLPRGAAACAAVVDLPVTGPGVIRSDTRPFVSTSGLTVRVLSYRYGYTSGDFARDLLFTSSDGGATFGPGVQVGTLSPGGDAAAGPGEGISLVNTASATHAYQRVPTDGSPPATTSAALSSQYLSGGSVALVTPTKPIVTFRDSATAAFTVYNGGSINDGSSWSAPQAIGPAGHERLAAGPGGVFVMLAAGGHLEARKFDGAAFGSPTVIPSSESNRLTASDVVQDPAGRLQALWPDASGTLFQSTSDDGVAWVTQPLTTFADVREMRGAATADHGGVATWTAASGADAKVYATALLPPPQPPRPPLDHPPVASFTFTPALPCTGQTVTFDASASEGYVGGGSLTYDWDIGAESPEVRNPEDRFDGSTGALPRLVRSFGPLRRERGPEAADNDIGVFVLGGIVYGRYFRAPVYVRLSVTDEAGVASEKVLRKVEFGDAGYRPFDAYDRTGKLLPPGPKPRCPQVAVPLPVAIASSGLVATGSRTSVTLTCPPGSNCVGRVTLSTAIASPRRARAAASRTVKLATRSFILAAGKKGKVKLTLGKRAQRLLHQKRRLQVTVAAATTNQSGKTVSSRRKTTLRLASRR